MMQFLREFGSWHWDGEYDDPEATEAFEATGSAETPEEFRRLHLILLRSTDPAARGTALDFFDRALATGRFGEDNPFEPHLDEVLFNARELLRMPPVAGRRLPNANHASAFSVLRNYAEAGDAPAIADYLERAPLDGNLDEALSAAGRALADADEPDPRLIALVTAVVENPEAGRHDREAAVRALGDVDDPAVTALFVAVATGDGEQRLRQDAAWRLVLEKRFYEHRELLTRLDATWPADERTWAASEIRDALMPGPHSVHWTDPEPVLGAEMAAALTEMRSPTSEAAHLAAFRAMLHSGVPAATGIALDHVHMDDGLDRFGIETADLAEEALAVARESLAVRGEEGLHASALRVVEWLAEPEDAGIVARFLNDRGIGARVRERATRAASDILEENIETAPELVEALDGLIFDKTVDIDARRLAVIALFDVPDPAVTALLERAAAAPEVEIQVEAAIGLSHPHLIERHRDLLEALTASWPKGDDEPDRSWLVRS